MITSDITPVVTCRHVIPRKQRPCKLAPLPHSEYCAEHSALYPGTGANLPDRIPCPLDPKHSVSKSKLAKHLKICNQNKFIYSEESWYEVDVNVEGGGEGWAKRRLVDVPLEEILHVIRVLLDYGHESRVCEPSCEPEEVTDTDVARFDDVIKDKRGGGALRHVEQQVALVKILEKEYRELGLSSDHSSFTGTCFVELGAGAGNMSQWIHTLDRQGSNFYVLVDRKNQRRKADQWFKRDGTPHLRLKMDIKDINIFRLPQLRNYNTLGVVCKHLCGGATDLALTAVCNAPLRTVNVTDFDPENGDPGSGDEGGGGQVSEEEEEEHPSNRIGTRVPEHSENKNIGVLIALCCHHLCTWDVYTGKAYFLSYVHHPKHFSTVTCMTAWFTGTFSEATCDFTSRVTRDKITPYPSLHVIRDEISGILTNPLPHIQNGNLVMEKELKSYLGRCAKTLLNDGRLERLQKEGFTVRTYRYVQEAISPENVALFAFKTNAK